MSKDKRTYELSRYIYDLALRIDQRKARWHLVNRELPTLNSLQRTVLTLECMCIVYKTSGKMVERYTVANSTNMIVHLILIIQFIFSNTLESFNS